MVRNFPRTTRSRALAALAVGSLLLGVAVVPLAAADDLKDKKHKVERQIAGASDDLDESSAQARRAASALAAAKVRLDAAQAQLAQTRGELAAAEVLDQQMQAKLDAAVARLDQARADLVAGRKKIADQQKTLRRDRRAELPDRRPVPDGPVDGADLAGPRRAHRPAELRAERPGQGVGHARPARGVPRPAHRAGAGGRGRQGRGGQGAQGRRREPAAQAGRSRRRPRPPSSRSPAWSSLREDAQQEADKAKRADLAQLHGLQKERSRIAAILKKRADEARRRAAAAARRAGHASGPFLSDNGPTHSNGFLDYPVVGPVTSPFGWRTHPIYGYRSLHDGVDFGAACGTPIRAAADGTVLEKYFQTAWGNRVIIDHGFHHGVGLATITNHMVGPAIVNPGQHVDRGQIVGYVGTTGWSTGCHLHYTVLQNGSPVDPMNWF